MLPLPAAPQLERGQFTAGIRRALRRVDELTLRTFDLRTPGYQAGAIRIPAQDRSTDRTSDRV